MALLPAGSDDVEVAGVGGGSEPSLHHFAAAWGQRSPPPRGGRWSCGAWLARGQRGGRTPSHIHWLLCTRSDLAVLLSLYPELSKTLWR